MHHHAFFNDKSDVYRAARPGYPDELLSYVAGLAPSRGVAWDCATGNGQAAIGLAKHFSVVHATDASENQIAHAIPHERIVYAVGVAEKSSFDDATIDLVTVAQALHWFEYSRFWPEIGRVLKPGGVFAAWGYDWFKVDADVDNLLRRTLLDRIESYWAAQNRILWNGYQGVFFPFEKLDTPTFQLKLHWDLESLFSYILSWSATRRCMESEGSQFLRDAFQAAMSAWGEPKDRRTIVMPLHLLAGIKR